MRQFYRKISQLSLLVLLVCCSRLSSVSSFQPAIIRVRPTLTDSDARSHRCLCKVQSAVAGADDDNDDHNNSPLTTTEVPAVPVKGMEKAWRHVKKPLLSIGSKGAAASHGNSLRQLLESHTAVKVKVSTQSYSGNLQAACDNLRALAIASGAPDGLEILQVRDSDNVILFGMPGTRDRIQSGDFPPEPVVWERKVKQQDEESE